MPGLVSPHGGGGLKPLVPSGEALAAERSRARTLRSLRISSREKGDLVMLGIGGFTPLATMRVTERYTIDKARECISAALPSRKH